MASYRKGDRVQTTGKGRTRTWGPYHGTVLSQLSPTSWEIHFDAALFTTDEMEEEEITPLDEERREGATPPMATFEEREK